ncbi:MAG TPA: peptide chain release factor 2 [Anaerolineales bacterium]|nr:peptide chain release factor 2 [Anaerolineales bacterium]HNA88591.1 peptide chain release factor 2 [Anaerolineales bacterium]HNB35241.1 peptide chain release factor 2 [Anaerolineales bacterium]HNC07638.1 peptide chain release factor 2 [Anaerolineales bacterium]
MQDLLQRLNAANELTQQLLERLDLTAKQNQLSQLEKDIEHPDFWNDSTNAQKVMKTVSNLRNEVEAWASINQQIHDLTELANLGDDSLRIDIETEILKLERELEKRSFAAMLSGTYDRDDAILAIHAGAGGTDSQDWADMLQRMYLRWIESHGFTAEILDTTPGEEAGIKSVTIAVSGEYSYGYLRSEKGVHRLVRLSPFDAAHRRHTSFALVEILPQVTMEEADIEINPSEIKMDVFRSSGAGGQNVQKNATAVRLTHIPTGIVVTCQNERSQTQNREFAMRILRARLLELRTAEKEEERAVLRGEYTKAEWGSQIRSYVLHPYQMVKDHRTEYQVGSAQSVLDGDLDEFMEAFLKSSQK